MNVEEKVEYFEFLNACQTIGGVCGSNSGFQRCLFDFLGDDWSEISILDLLGCIEEARKEFNRRQKLARGW